MNREDRPYAAQPGDYVTRLIAYECEPSVVVGARTGDIDKLSEMNISAQGALMDWFSSQGLDEKIIAKNAGFVIGLVCKEMDADEFANVITAFIEGAPRDDETRFRVVNADELQEALS